MFKGLGNLASLMRSAQDIGDKLGDVSQQLKQRRASGVSGGGMVVVEVNGLGQVLKVTIEQTLIENSEHEMIQTLLPAAINQATAKAKQMHIEAMKELTGGIPLPGLDNALGQLVGDHEHPVDEIGSDQIGPSDIGAGDIRPGDIGPGEIDPDDIESGS